MSQDKFQLFELGMQASSSHIITEENIQSFSQISGDFNPIHIDEEYAKNTNFGKKIAHGLISASFFSGLFGTKLPGISSLYVSQSLKFLRPVYIGDEVIATVRIKKIDAVSRHIHFDTICIVRDKKVIAGVAEIFYPLETNDE
jgi:3-hydroxybutyryl-CoA dehydratase